MKMHMTQAHRQHLRSLGDLKTTETGFRAGAATLLLEHRRRAEPILTEARVLKFLLGRGAHVTTCNAVTIGAARLLNLSAWLLSFGVEWDCGAPISSKKAEDIVFRFLLARGDTLGGSMRNIGGFIAQKKLTRAILACLKLAGHQCHWLHADTKAWVELSPDNADVELSLRGLSWNGPKGPRTILYNIKVPLVGNNVDLSVLKCPFRKLNREILHTPSNYIALGELKGGIDPGGADEHWKTAGSTVNRIQKPFAQKKLKPDIFFIAAAIEAKMAVEIWDLLKTGKLANAANLTDDDQISSITSWLCSR